MPVREVGGAPRVDCPRRGEHVLFSECQSCEHGTVVRLKGAGLPYLLCPTEGEAPSGLALWPRDTVRAIMTKVVTVRRSLSLEKLVRLFIDEGISAAPVIDEAGKPVGIVSKTDLSFDGIGWTELRDAALSAWPEGSERYDARESEGDLYMHELLRERTAGDLMTRTVVWVTPDMTVSAVAEAMAKSGLHHLPVLGEGAEPIGMVNADELARWLAARR